MPLAAPPLLALVFALAGSPELPEGAGIITRPLEPEPIRIRLEDLPEPHATESARSAPRVVDPPSDPVLFAPEGFEVSLYAEAPSARWLCRTPDGRVLCVSSRTNTIYLLTEHGPGGAEASVFADARNALDLPFGMAFVEGAFYVGNTGEVRRYPYEEGQTRLEGRGEAIAELPGHGYNQHWTRNVIPDAEGTGLYVSVGSRSNADVEPLPRASVLHMKLDGSERRVVATGLRNPVGLAIDPRTGRLWTTVNERDALGDGLVPDYLAPVEEGGFYGWPYAYLSPENVDPRHADGRGRSVRPELAEKTITPPVLFEAHSAALGLAFADPGAQNLPEKYRRGAFVAMRGSWNRSRGTGYKIVFVPFDEQGHALGHYEDFVTGFLLDPGVPLTWGRPVGVLVLENGDVLFTEEMHGRVYRVRYVGE